MYKNDFGEKIFISYSNYNMSTTDNKNYDKIINPFDLNVTKNNPYTDVEKNKCCFYDIDLPYEKILLICQTKEVPNFDDMYEIYYDYKNDKCDVDYVGSIVNKYNQLVVLGGTSIIILDINTLEVVRYISSDRINDYGINIFNINDFYIVEDIKHEFTVFDEELNIINNYSKELKKIINKLMEDSKKKYWYFDK